MSNGWYQNSSGSSNHFPTPINPGMTPSPPHQYSPDPRMNQPRSPYYTTPSPAQHVYSPEPRMFQTPQSCSYNSSPSHYHVQPPYSPNPRMYSYYNSGPRNPSSMSPSPYPAEGGHSGHFQARGPYQSSYANNVRTPSFKGTPRPSSFVSSPRGAGSGYGNSGRGRGGRSGLGRGGDNQGHRSVSAELKPDKFYNRLMVEDPWKDLKPSIWKNETFVSVKGGFRTPDSATLSHSDSLGTKKARISEASKEESSSQPSLAAYLAAAFNKAVGEKEGNNE